MCVEHFREYCNASYFKVDEKGSFERDLNDPNMEFFGGAYFHYSDIHSVYYVTDLKQIKRLAKQGNMYAINHLNNE